MPTNILLNIVDTQEVTQAPGTNTQGTRGDMALTCMYIDDTHAHACKASGDDVR